MTVRGGRSEQRGQYYAQSRTSRSSLSVGGQLAISRRSGVRDKVAREESLEKGLPCNGEGLLNHEDNGQCIPVLIYLN